MKKVLLSTLALIFAVHGISTFNVFAESSNPLNINFGTQLTKQETDGYAALNGNTYERFQQAKNELPDEIPVITRIPVTGQNVFYISADGDDSNSGLSVDKAFKTLDHALDAVKAQNDTDKAKGTVIYICGGEYYIPENIQITQEHCSSDAPLFISAYNGENVTFTTVQSSFRYDDLKKITENAVGFANYSRLPYETRCNGYYIDYEDIGLTRITTDADVMEGNSKLVLARYPNAGYDSVKDVINGGYGKACEWVPMMDKVFEWVDTAEIHVYGKFAYEWAFNDSTIRIDRTTGSIQGTGSLSYSDYPVSKYLRGVGTSMYYYYNIMEELDVPGEWFADNTAKKLYIYPLSENPNSYTIYSNGDVFSLTNAQNVVIDGININGAKNAVCASNSKNTVIQNCKIENISDKAIYFSETEKCGLINSYISGANQECSLIDITAAKLQLYPRRNFVQNNVIVNGRTAIRASGIGDIISHNLIKNTANSALVFTGAENIIEYNEFSGVQKLVGDSGGTYTGTNFYIRNNHVRYNYFHDSKQNAKNGRAVYFDDCGDGNFAYGNIIRNYNYGIYIHGGSSNVVEGNTVIDTREPISNAYDYAINGIYDDQMQDMYLVRGRVMEGYTEKGYDKSVTWQTRYNSVLNDKYTEITEAKALFATLGTEQEAAQKVRAVTYYKATHSLVPYTLVPGYANVKKCVDLIVDHDCWYMNNTSINCTLESGFGTVVGMNNVEEGNKTLTNTDADAYIRDNIVYFDKIGVNEVTVDAKEPTLHLKNGAVINSSDFNGFSWDSSDAASYYKVQIATDEEFSNIVVDYTANYNEMSLYRFRCASADAEVERIAEYTYNDSQTGDTDFVEDKVYYAKVIACNNDMSLDVDAIESQVCSFTLSENYIPDNEWDIIQGNISGYVQIEGTIPYGKANKAVNIVVYDKSVDNGQLENNLSAIKHLAQIEADLNGKFAYKFKLDDCDLSSLKTAVRVGDDELAENEFTQCVQSFIEFTLDVSVDKDIDSSDIVKAVAKANNKLGTMDKYTIAIAEYSSDGRFIACTYEEYDVNDVNDSTTKYTVKNNTKQIKVFAWSDMKPIIQAIDDLGN